MTEKCERQKSCMDKYETSLKMCLPFRCGKEKDKSSVPDEKIGCFSFMSLNWFNGFMWKASRRKIEVEKIGKIKARNGVDVNSKKLQRLWDEEVNRRGFENASLFRTVCKFNRTRIVLITMIISLMIVFHYISQTWFLLRLLEYLSNTTNPLWVGVMWAAAISIGQLLRHITFSMFWITGAYSGIKLVGALQGVIYDQILHSKSSAGIQLADVINHCTSDLERVFQLMQTSLLMVPSVISTILNIVYCYELVGVWSLIGNLIIILYYPMMMVVAKTTGKFRASAARIADKRINLMNQFLTNIKFVKSMSWEQSVYKSVKDVRDKEVKILKNATYLQSLSWSTAPIIGALAPMLTIIGHLFSGGTLDAPQVFTLIAAYGALSMPLNTLPIGVKALSEGIISCKRIQTMLKPQRQNKAYKHISEYSPRAIVIAKADIGWENNSDELERTESESKNSSDKSDKTFYTSNVDLVEKKSDKEFSGIVNVAMSESLQNLSSRSTVLENINLNIEKGQLIGICGQVGSGKSTLLSSICGSTNIFDGSINVNGSIALATQQAWIFGGTVKDNIIFGSSFDSEWYKHVIRSCSLEKDFQLMANGDQTKIGEQGSNLSGGQKQRINVARALYSKKDIYLLDDPLSAVDAKVAKHIFKNCIQNDLKDKTVLLVTHAVHFLKKCDYVVVMKDGKIIEQGTHDTLMSNGKEYLQMIHTTDEQRNQMRAQVQDLNQKKVERALSLARDDDVYNETAVSEEVDQATSLSLKSFLFFCKSCGGYIVSFLVFMSVVVFSLALLFNNIWLKVWLSDPWNSTDVGNASSPSETVIELGEPRFYMYFWIYVASLGLIILFGIFKGLAFGTSMLRGSANLHWAMFRKVIRSPMSFFDTTPLGQIINRFSRDIDEMDTYIPYYTEFVSQILILTLFQIITISVLYPWFAIALVIISVLYILFDKLLIKGIKETKRIDNLLKPLVITQLSTTVQGLDVIKCYNKQELVKEKFKEAVEKHLAAYLMYQLSPKWLSFRADIIGWVAVTGMALTTVFFKNSQSSVDAGLAMTQILIVCGTLAVAIRWKSELVAKFISIERVSNYCKKLQEEAPSKIDGALVQPWPSSGKIEFQNVDLKYRPDCPLVLQGITFTIQGGEKVGFIGRTGAGKSSIIGAILRLTELHNGKITIDNVDISKIGLDDLRSKMAVIPQDPVLFDGTIRWNLDPNNLHSDEEIWAALENAYLKNKFSKEANGLETLFNAESGMLSVGEKQLLCLARALLKNSKILLLDEATANIDIETDQLIQKSIRKSFANCTVLTIAHRLITVADYDKIVTLEAGKVIEFDTPANLLSKESQFRSMMNSQ